MKNDNLILYANYYHNWGMNLSPINYDGKKYKEPLDENWENFIDTEQNLQYIQSNDWITATGIGCILGYNGYRALDIDQLFTTQEDLLFKEEREIKVKKFISNCLNMLALPRDYQWIVKSGSGYGIHIIFRTENTDIKDAVYAYSPAKRYRDPYYGNSIFDLIEFRCRAFLVLPPSIHDNDNNFYTFYNGAIPTYKPHIVDISNIRKLINYYCADLYFIDCNYKDYKFPLVRNVKSIEKYVSGSYELTRTDDDVHLLLQCKDSDAYNTLGVLYAIGNDDVKADLGKAQDYFIKANCELSHFNLAALMSCGAICADNIEFHLNFCRNIDKTKIDNIKHNYHHLLNITADANNKQKKQFEKPYYLFYDTETLGLPERFDVSYKDIDNWPRLIQLSWLLTDKDGNIINSNDYIVYPEEFEIPLSISNLTGITNSIAKTIGTPLKDIINAFAKDVNQTQYLVGHNESFDRNILSAEIYRLRYTDFISSFISKPSLCTMKESVDYCQIKNYYGKGYKYPSLQELYNQLFGTKFEGEHNAKADVYATMKCFWELKKRGIITTCYF